MSSPPGPEIWGYLQAELRRLDVHILAAVHAARSNNPQYAGDEYRGLYVSDQDVEIMMAGSVGPASPVVLPEGLGATLRLVDEEIIAWRRAAPEQPLVRLASRLGLTAFEQDAVLACLAPEVDQRYERLFGYLHDDVTRKRPTPRLIMDLFCRSAEERLEARGAFLPTAPLLARLVIRMAEDASSRHQPLLARPLKLDDAVVEHALGASTSDPRLEPAVRLLRVDDEAGWAPGVDQARLKHIGTLARDRAEAVLLIGSDAEQRKAATRGLGRFWGRAILAIEAPVLARLDLSPDAAVALALRQAALLDAIPYLDEIDSWSDDGGLAWLSALVRALATHPGTVMLGTRAAWEPPIGRPPLRLEVPDLAYFERKHMWAGLLDGQVPADAIGEVAGKFRLNAGQIQAAVRTADSLARSAGRVLAAADLLVAARQHSNQNLARLARKVVPLYAWDDIILPADRVHLLREICQYVRHGHTVYGEWGFDRKLSLGKGLNALFAGPSGTGKTMAAEIIAREVGLDAYKINLATIVSKYIGETEKNLDRIFTEARDSNAILFFDEADAIFGKRSEVRDSHDRYANIEIAYLLQKMEEYDGVSILATNLRKNIDEAFVRRMHFTVEFPMPEEDDRLRIWRKIFPPQAPLASDVDLVFLARQFRSSGGNIKNIAVAAAFLAADEDSSIQMRHLIWATKRELQKMGRLVTEVEFGPYFSGLAVLEAGTLDVLRPGRSS